MRIQGKTIKLDPKLFPEDLEPELFKIHEDENTLFFALYSTKAIKIFRLNKEAPESLPELILDKTTNNIENVPYSQTPDQQAQELQKIDQEKIFWITRHRGTKHTRTYKHFYSDFELTDQDLVKLPASMRPYVRSSEKNPAKLSIKVMLSGRNKDLEKSSLKYLVELTDLDLIIKRAKKWEGDRNILFKINSKKWLRRHLIRYEKSLTGKTTIDKAGFEKKYKSTLRSAIGPYRPFSRLSSPQEALKLVAAGRRHETLHIASSLSSGTRLFLSSINLRLRKEVRSQIINVIPGYENEDAVAPRQTFRFKIGGLVWNVQKDRALVLVKDSSLHRTTFYKMDHFTDIKKRVSEVLHEVSDERVPTYGYYFDRNWVDDTPLQEERILSWLRENLETNPKTGHIDTNGVLFTESFKPFVKEIILEKIEKSVRQNVAYTLPLKGPRSEGLALLCCEKSIFLYNSKSESLVWEMTFKHNIVGGKIAQGKIAEIDSRANHLNVYGVNEGTERLGLVKRVNLAKIGLFDCFEKEDKRINHLRLLEFFYLEKEKKYLAIIQQLPLKKQPSGKYTKSPNAEECIIFKHLVDRWPQEEEQTQKHQHLGLLKLSPEFQVTEMSTLKFSTEERIVTSIDGDSLTILRAKLEEPEHHHTPMFNEFNLEFYSLQSLKRDESRAQPRSFSFRTDNSVSNFIYKDPGYLLMVMSYFRITGKADYFNQNTKELRKDRISIMRGTQGIDDIIEDQRYAFVLAFDDIEEQNDQPKPNQEDLGGEGQVKEDKSSAKKSPKSKKRSQKRRPGQGGRPKKGARRALTDSIDSEERELIKGFKDHFQGVTIVRCQPLNPNDPGPMTFSQRKTRIANSSSQSPSGYFSYLNDSNLSKSQTLKLGVWSNRFKKLKSKSYPRYFNRFKMGPTHAKKDWITISGFHPLDEFRFVLHEYHTELVERKDWRRIEGFTTNKGFELARDGMFKLAYMDIRSQKIKRFLLEAPNLILNRVLVWERGINDEESGEEEKMVVADFDEEMNLVLFDLHPLINNREEARK